MLTTVTLTLRLPTDDAADLADTGQAGHRRLTCLADLIRAGEVDLVKVLPAVTATATAVTALLTPQEYRLVWTLQEQRGRLVPYRLLLCALWGEDGHDASDIPTVRTHVRNIRRKLRALGLSPSLIRSSKERGYMLVEDVELLPPDAPRLAPLRPTKARP